MEWVQESKWWGRVSLILIKKKREIILRKLWKILKLSAFSNPWTEKNTLKHLEIPPERSRGIFRYAGKTLFPK